MNNGFGKHNHNKCVRASIDALEKYCESKGLKITVIRKRVLEILLEGHKAIGAYEILDKLRYDGAPAQPPIAYRALKFLVSNGFAHKIERLNAYIACGVPGQEHRPAFLICKICKDVSEAKMGSADLELQLKATTENFIIENSIIEAIGLCPSCS